MIIESIRVQNFLSHSDSTVDFTDAPLWLICGENGDNAIVANRGLVGMLQSSGPLAGAVTPVPFSNGASGPTTLGTTSGPPYGTLCAPGAVTVGGAFPTPKTAPPVRASWIRLGMLTALSVKLTQPLLAL